MKVFLREIPYEGLAVHQVVGAEELGLDQENFLCLGPLEIDSFFEKADEELLAQVTVLGSYELCCSRCLGPIKQEKRQDHFEFVFDLTPKTEFIEYKDDIRQELMIALTKVIRCKTDCRGLCPGCGVNLNSGMCRCNTGSDPSKVKIQFDN